jgi:hypothetical protein
MTTGIDMKGSVITPTQHDRQTISLKNLIQQASKEAGQARDCQAEILIEQADGTYMITDSAPRDGTKLEGSLEGNYFRKGNHVIPVPEGHAPPEGYQPYNTKKQHEVYQT